MHYFWGGSWALLGNNQFLLYLGIIGENNKQFTEPISPKLRFHLPSLISEWCRAWAKQTCILITPAWLFKQHVQHDPTYQWGQGKQPPQHKSPAASDLHSWEKFPNRPQAAPCVRAVAIEKRSGHRRNWSVYNVHAVYISIYILTRINDIQIRHMFVCLYVCLYVCLFVCFCLFLFVFVCLCLFIFVHVCSCLFMFVYVCLCLFMFV